ncbi:8-oxo-dGTP diphosphatase [Nanoarchaeota archaeon]
MIQATLCFLINKQSGEVLLGMKKRGFGSGKYNGFGGKVTPDETVEESVVRELQEECGVTVKNLKKKGVLDFFFSEKKEWDQTVHVFVTEDWDGEPIESEEMAPKWFKYEDIPFHTMWSDDPHWLPSVLKDKNIKAEFTFGSDNESIVDMNVKEE